MAPRSHARLKGKCENGEYGENEDLKNAAIDKQPPSKLERVAACVGHMSLIQSNSCHNGMCCDRDILSVHGNCSPVKSIISESRLLFLCINCWIYSPYYPRYICVSVPCTVGLHDPFFIVAGRKVIYVAEFIIDFCLKETSCSCRFAMSCLMF